MFKLSARSLERREGVDPQLCEVSDLALTITLIDFGYPKYAGLRTAEEQNELHLSGASPNCDGYDVKSEHQADPEDGLGKALDFYAYVDRKASWDPLHLTHVAAAHLQAASILGYAVEWGGFFSPTGWDKPHIKLVKKQGE